MSKCFCDSFANVMPSLTMANMEDHRRIHGGIVAAALLILSLPMLYFLSVGPVYAWYLGREMPSAIYSLYAPLTWLVNHFKPANDVLDWYLGFWLS